RQILDTANPSHPNEITAHLPWILHLAVIVDDIVTFNQCLSFNPAARHEINQQQHQRLLQKIALANAVIAIRDFAGSTAAFSDGLCYGAYGAYDAYSDWHRITTHLIQNGLTHQNLHEIAQFHAADFREIILSLSQIHSRVDRCKIIGLLPCTGV